MSAATSVKVLAGQSVPSDVEGSSWTNNGRAQAQACQGWVSSLPVGGTLDALAAKSGSRTRTPPAGKAQATSTQRRHGSSPTRYGLERVA